MYSTSYLSRCRQYTAQAIVLTTVFFNEFSSPLPCIYNTINTHDTKTRVGGTAIPVLPCSIPEKTCCVCADAQLSSSGSTLFLSTTATSSCHGLSTDNDLANARTGPIGGLKCGRPHLRVQWGRLATPVQQLKGRGWDSVFITTPFQWLPAYKTHALVMTWFDPGHDMWRTGRNSSPDTQHACLIQACDAWRSRSSVYILSQMILALVFLCNF